MRRIFLQAARRRGFTLIELSIVIGVIGAIVGAIWWAATNSSEAQKETDAATELQTVSHNILAMMQGRNFQTCVAGNTNITSCLISAQAIPPGYVNGADNTLADNPWSAGNFMVFSLANGFRITFYEVTQKGCLALLNQGTACDAGQAGCPTQVATNDLTHPATPDGTLGWGGNWKIGTTSYTASMGASDLCAENTYPGTSADNAVQLDYSLR